MKKFVMRRLGVADATNSVRPSLQDCIEAVLEQSGTLIDDVLQGLEATVAQSKAKSGSLSQRHVNSAAIAQLRQQADALRATFAAQLRNAIYYSGSQGGGDDQPLVRFEDLQLLEEKQLDANIEFALAQQEIQLAVDDVLPPLNALISSLLGWLTVRPHLNPLRPEAFARGLRETLTLHVPSEEARSTIVTPAAGFMGASLRSLYKELADWLRTQGVEPVELPSAADGGTRPKAQNSIVRTMVTLDKLRRLLSGELDGPGEGGVKDFLHTVPAPMVAMEDMKLVEPMMKRLSQRASQSAGSVSAAAGVGKQPGRKLGTQLGEEVVRMMLDNLMLDKRLLPKVRAQIKLLEPVLLRLSQSDTRFFSERKHPARLLLDKITHRSLGFSAETDPGFQLFFHTVSTAVKQLAGTHGDAGSFASALKWLEDRWEHKETEQREKQEKTTRALMHAEQRNLLAHRLATDFQQRLKGKPVAPVVVNFLMGPWAQVVAEAQLGGAGAQDYLDLVDDLIWSVQPSLARRNRGRLLEAVPSLLIMLRRGLQTIRYPQERTAAFLDGLVALHEKSFDSATEAEATVAPAPIPAPAPAPQPVPQAQPAPAPQPAPQAKPAPPPPPVPEPKPAPPAEVIDDAAFWVDEGEAGGGNFFIDVQAEDASQPEGERHWSEVELAVGTWVELRLDRRWVRAQLTWTSPHRTLFMFTSSQGDAHSMSRRSLDRLRDNDELKIVASGHVVDSALDAVAQAALRNNRN